jgi:hypothetical protein
MKIGILFGTKPMGNSVDRLTSIIQTTDGGYLIGAHQTLIFQPKRPIIHAEILIYGSLKLTNPKYNVAKKHLRQQF